MPYKHTKKIEISTRYWGEGVNTYYCKLIICPICKHHVTNKGIKLPEEFWDHHPNGYMTYGKRNIEYYMVHLFNNHIKSCHNLSDEEYGTEVLHGCFCTNSVKFYTHASIKDICARTPI